MKQEVQHVWPKVGPAWGLIVFLFGATLALFFLDLLLGSVSISFVEVWQAVWNQEESNPVTANIIWKIRFPRACTAILAGSALSVGGLQMQTLFRNPLAGPSVLGISSGASLGVAILMFVMGSSVGFLGIGQLALGGSTLLALAGSLGAAAIFVLILLLSLQIRDNIILLILGIMMGFITTSLVSIWQYFSDPGQIQDYLIWSFGSLEGLSKQHLTILGLCVSGGILLSFLLSKPLNMLLLGEDYARSLGLNIRTARIGIILSTSVLAGAVTGFCGPIGFVGIAVPHLSRYLFKTSDHRILIPCTCLIGAIILLLCDLIAQLPGYSIALPVNAVTSLIGAPVVIAVILRRRTHKSSF